MNAKRLLAVDMGASGGKCFVGTFDDGSFSMQEIHRFAHEGSSFFVADKAGAISERTHWDDIFIYRNIVDGLRAYARDVASELDSIGIDTWGADGHLVSENGDILGKIYCYRDHRLDNMIEEVKARIAAKRLYEITGIHFQPFNLSNQLLWLLQNRPELVLPGATFLPIPTVFNYYLCGEKVVDSSWASVTQLMDAKDKKWSDEILDRLGIPPALMPTIVEPGTVIGELHGQLAESIGINQAKMIAVASHDTASAFAAAPVENPGEALIISSGTWALIGKLVPEPITSQDAMSANISNEGGIGNVRFLKNCMGGWLVQELRRIWRHEDGEEMSWKELDRLTEEAPAFTAFIDPDDPGFYNPSNMQTAMADFCSKTGQAVPPDRGAFMRVVYESLAMKYRLVNEQICAASGTQSKVVNIVGGGCNNIMLNQFTADAMGMPVLTGPEDATAVGNLMVQAMAMGIIGSMQEAQPLIRQAFPIKQFDPSAAADWNGPFEKFRGLVG